GTQSASSRLRATLRLQMYVRVSEWERDSRSSRATDRPTVPNPSSPTFTPQRAPHTTRHSSRPLYRRAPAAHRCPQPYDTHKTADAADQTRVCGEARTEAHGHDQPRGLVARHERPADMILTGG